MNLLTIKECPTGGVRVVAVNASELLARISNRSLKAEKSPAPRAKPSGNRRNAAHLGEIPPRNVGLGERFHREESDASDPPEKLQAERLRVGSPIPDGSRRAAPSELRARNVLPRDRRGDHLDKKSLGEKSFSKSPGTRRMTIC